MGLFKNIRISQRILLLVGGLALGFIGIGVAYYWQIGIETEVREKRQAISQNQKLLSETRVGITELNRLLLEFIAYRNTGLVSEQAQVKEQIVSHIKSFDSGVNRGTLVSDLNKLESLVLQYDKLFHSASDQLTQLNNFLEADSSSPLDAAARTLENRIRGFNERSVLQAYFSMRGQEQRFLLGNSPSAAAKLKDEILKFESVLDQADLSSGQKNSAMVLLESYSAVVEELNQSFESLRLTENQLHQLGENLLATVTAAIETMESSNSRILSDTEKQSQFTTVVFIAMVFMIAIGVAFGVYFIYRSIVFPMAHIQSVIRRINKGNLKARVKILENDELGDLGRAFNVLLDDRINTLQGQAEENEKLNDSIIELITALGEIAKKNLSVKVPVSADITGTISDAVNLLTKETADTLRQVQGISQQVNKTADTLQAQAAIVVRVAEDERKQVMATSKALDLSAKAINEIAARAETADTIATKTIKDTKDARNAVTKTVNGILTIRESISETEKRMKRLGERSQEISGIVNLINTIAERTHILALNASMHAASAGEAGKGFAVVADEVQRLAENAREATAEISSMVNNIRVETSDTVTTMNKLITEVAQGTRLAEQANQHMQITEDATRQLVETVQVISHSSVQQAQISNSIRDRSNIIRKFTEKTGTLLAQQKRHTDSLKHFADLLNERVNVFTLPETSTFVEVPELEKPETDDVQQQAS